MHYIGWPDHGVPTGDSIEDFKLMLEDFINLVLNSALDEKAIVHCSAGIGRTGTTIALLQLIINTCAQKNNKVTDPLVSVFSVVRRLREQRPYMVQMPDQYIFIYQFFLYWLKSNKFI